MRFFRVGVCGLLAWAGLAWGQVQVVAAENFYGSVAAELGGPYVKVASLLDNPKQDPHLFSASMSHAKLLTDAEVIVYNGAGYDAWMEPMLAINDNHAKLILDIAKLMKVSPSSNPHLWYNPKVMPKYARTMSAFLQRHDVAHRIFYQQQLNQFLKNELSIAQKIKLIKKKYPHLAVIATEPLSDYLLQSLGWKILGQDFALSMMNETSPTPQQIKQFYADMSRAKILIYNQQVSSPLIDQMKIYAQQHHLALVGFTEMQPAGLSYLEWMNQNLTLLTEAAARATAN